MNIPTDGLRVELPFIELPKDNRRINVSCKECFLMLFDKYVTYKVICNYSSVNNDEGILKDYKCNNNRVWMRSDITLVEMFKDNGHDTWAVGLKFCGEGPEWDFNEVSNAKELYNKLMDYFITR